MQTKQDMLDNLILTCVKEIEHTGAIIAGNNQVRCPMVFMYFGEYPIDNYDIVKSIIDNNWRVNSKYIYHIGAKLEGTEIIACNLVDQAVLNDNIKDNTIILDEIFSAALAAPIGTFSDNNVVKVNIVLSANDKNVEKYIDFVSALNTSLNGLNVFKDLYVLITQGGTFEERSATDSCIKMLYTKEKADVLKNFKQVFILSNRMKNGAVLDQFNKRTNFRLIADTSLLLDNDDENYQSRKKQFYFGEGKLRTISHRIVQKPCREIVVAMLKTLIHTGLDIQRKDKEQVMQMFADEQFEEIYFSRNFKKSLPQEEDFRYLPYTGEGLKKLLAIYKSSKSHGMYRIDEDIVDKETYGCYTEFFEHNYRLLLTTNFNASDFKKQLADNCIEKYNHRDIIEYFKYDDIVEEACKPQKVVIEKKFATSFYSVLARHCYLKARNEYFELIRPTFHSAMMDLHNDAVNFEKLLIEMQNDISSVCIIESEGIYQSIEKYYSEYVIEYFNKHKSEILSQVNIRVKDYKELTEVLIKLFMKILSMDTRNLLVCGFSEELNNRLGTAATPGTRDKLIKDALIPRIDEYTRINVAEDNLHEIFDAYLCDEHSNFLDAINTQVRFNTNNENCFEHLKIYEFNSIRDILGSKMEGGQ